MFSYNLFLLYKKHRQNNTYYYFTSLKIKYSTLFGC